MGLAVSSWSFHRPLYAGRMRLWDVPGRARALGFSTVELQDVFLWPYGNRVFWTLRRFLGPPNPAPPGRFYDYGLLQRVRRALRLHNMALIAWTCDPEFGHSNDFAGARAYVRMALRTARRLGASVLRITVDHAAVGEDTGAVVGVLRELAASAGQVGVRMALENHGCAAAAEQILDIIRGVDSPWLGVCLDFGNFRPGHGEEDFERLAPFAIHAHAKSYAFDDSGEEISIPYRHRIGVLRSTGYTGTLSIEYEGDGDPVEGIEQTRRLIERYW
jgi:sugar phosphate isomerase/epimerase